MNLQFKKTVNYFNFKLNYKIFRRDELRIFNISQRKPEAKMFLQDYG